MEVRLARRHRHRHRLLDSLRGGPAGVVLAGTHHRGAACRVRDRRPVSRFNIGCGPVVAEGWVNVDRDPHRGAIRGDMTEHLPFDTGAGDVVVAHHVLQMGPDPRLVPALAEMRRLLRGGGVLRVSVPSLEAAWRAYEEADRAHFLIDD